MKMMTREWVGSMLLLGALSISPASAMTQHLSLVGVVGVSTATLSATVEDGVATIFGTVDSGIEEALVKNYVANIEGVDEVIDHITSK